MTCQLCMDDGRAQLVLHEGAWHPWPLVCVRSDDAPVIATRICPACETDRFNAEEVPRLNDVIAHRMAERATP